MLMLLIALAAVQEAQAEAPTPTAAVQEVQVEVPAEVLAACAGPDARCDTEEIDLADTARFDAEAMRERRSDDDAVRELRRGLARSEREIGRDATLGEREFGARADRESSDSGGRDREHAERTQGTVIGGVIGGLIGDVSSSDFAYCRTNRDTAARRSENAVETSFRAGAVYRQKSVATTRSTVQVYVGYRPEPRKFYYVDVDLSRVPTTYSPGGACRVTVRSIGYVEGVGRVPDAVSRRVFVEIRRALK